MEVSDTKPEETAKKLVEYAVKKEREKRLRGACIHGTLEMVIQLLTEGAEVNARDNSGRTCLHNAVSGNREIVTELLARGAAVLIA